MILNTEVINNYSPIKQVHAFISIVFLIIAVWLIIRSVRGIIKDIAYSRLDKYLSYGFIINLYLQLIFGFILFANHNAAVDDNYSNAAGAIKIVANRFWPVEHMILMLFALFIANLGLILSSQSLTGKEKHKKVLTYYSIAIFMITISLIAI
jgi:hypothetical protein